MIPRGDEPKPFVLQRVHLILELLDSVFLQLEFLLELSHLAVSVLVALELGLGRCHQLLELLVLTA